LLPPSTRASRVRPHIEQPQDSEIIGRSLLPTKHRQLEFRYGRLSQFMQQHKEDIAGNECHQVLAPLLRQPLQAQIGLKRMRNLRDPGLEPVRLSCCLRKCRPAIAADQH
jgi:hypothetical protein